MTPEDERGDDNGGGNGEKQTHPSLDDTIRSAPTEELSPDLIQRSPTQPVANRGHLHPGDIFDSRYRILEMVGHGGFCEVFRAVETNDGTSVALKFLRNPEAAATLLPRMQRELRLARDLGHPNIVKVYDLIESEGQFCLVMDFVEGSTLKKVITDDGQMRVERAFPILVALTSAIAAVHASQIVHRDLKPQNVMVTTNDEVKLLDFGLARTTDSTGLTATGTILGTPDYMSPEQVNGKPTDARSDVYSLGIIAWELFAGNPPFSGDTPIAVALQHVRSRAPAISTLRPDVPESISHLIHRMTEPAPDSRPASGEAVLFELERDSDAGATTIDGPISGRVRWKRWAFAAAGAVALAITGISLTGSSAPSNPFGDGRIVACVQPRTHLLSSNREKKIFLENVADLIPEQWNDQRITHQKLDGNVLNDLDAARSLGVEHVLEVSLQDDSEDSQGALRLRLRVFSTNDGSIWWESEGSNDLALDITEMLGVSQNLAEQYALQIDSALRDSSTAVDP